VREGARRTHLVLQRLTETPDALNQPVQSWTDIADYYALVRPLRGQEAIVAKQTRATASDAIFIHYPAAGQYVDVKDRFIDKNYPMQTPVVAANGGRVFNVVDIQDEKGTQRELKIVAEEVK